MEKLVIRNVIGREKAEAISTMIQQIGMFLEALATIGVEYQVTEETDDQRLATVVRALSPGDLIRNKSRGLFKVQTKANGHLTLAQHRETPA